jgi:hypothetical protein
VRAMQERRWLTAEVAGKQNYCALPHLGMHSSNHVPFLSRPHAPHVPSRRDPQLTAQLLTLQVSLISLCSGCVMANWTVINTYGCARLVTMNLDHGTEIPCLQATP